MQTLFWCCFSDTGGVLTHQNNLSFSSGTATRGVERKVLQVPKCTMQAALPRWSYSERESKAETLECLRRRGRLLACRVEVPEKLSALHPLWLHHCPADLPYVSVQVPKDTSPSIHETKCLQYFPTVFLYLKS